MNNASDLRRMRTRWRRWLGNKTARGKPYWVTLLDSSWSTWCFRVCDNHQIEYCELEWNREAVKQLYRSCIDVATFKELMRLDDIYAAQVVSDDR